MVKKFKRKFVNAKYFNFKFFKNLNSGYSLENFNMESEYLQMVNWIFNVSKYPAYFKTNTEFLSSGIFYFESLIKDLENAKKAIFLELFIISPGK